MSIMRNMSKRDRRAHFKTFALENGPAILGIPTKKPHPKTLESKGGRVDEEGVWYSIFEDHDSLEVYKLEVKHLVYSTIATDINVKRALRWHVEPTRRLEEDVRRRLPAGNLLGRDGRLEEGREAAGRENSIDHPAVGRRRNGKAKRGSEAADRLDRVVDQRKRNRVAGE